MKELFETPSAIVQQAEETEQQLIERARQADSDAAWTIGECASLWTQRYAKGRTDADFAKLVGLSRDVVTQRRLVHETFSDVCDSNHKLCWTHFYVALNWDDASECLAWADENGATVAEMKAWRRMQHGEDLTVDPDDDDDLQAEGQAEGHEDAADEEHVADVDPHQKPPSTVKDTPPDFEPEAPDYDANEPPAEESATKRTAAQSNPEKPVEPASFTLDDLRRLIVAAEDTTGDAREAKKLAEWHRMRADELDPPEKSVMTNSSQKEKEPTVSTAQASAIAEEWNLISGISRCRFVTEKRRRAITARMKDKFWRENWRAAMQKVARSPFCRGSSKSGWIADIDWFLRPDTVVRLLEGAYDDSEKASQMMDTLREWAAEGDDE